MGAKLTLLTPTLLGKLPAFWSGGLCYPELANASAPLEPYSHLCETYHDYAECKLADYTGYLTRLAKEQTRELRSLLDVACGSGSTTERLAATFPKVVGIDASPAMLAHAERRCSRFPGVRFVQADFRGFQLDRRFDAAVSATNSLNYIQDIDELAAVFQAVAAHLQPGGWFVFDAFTEHGMRLVSGRYLHVEVKGQRFVMHFNYDRQRRVENARVLFPSGIETHTRIPIEPKDVENASRVNGLRLRDYFAMPLLPGRWYSGALCYYWLEKIANGKPEERP